MAAKGPPSEAAMKEMIVTHMNNDHIDSVQRYVEHYNKVPRSASRSARLTDITNSEMTITAAGNNYKVPFDPPMSSLKDARGRVVQMDADCIKALGRSSITIKEFPTPPLLSSVFFTAVTIGAFLLLSDEKYVLPGSWFYDYYLRFMPYFPYIFQTYRQYIGGFIVVVHGIEAIIMSGKLKKHSVPLYSRPWILWIASQYFIGFSTFARFDALVEERRIAKEKAKH